MFWSSYTIPRPIHHITNDAAVIKAHDDFVSKRPNNLEFLFKKRFEWMNQYTEGKQLVVDLGSGLGFSREYIKNPIVLTDIIKYPWTDQQVDALNPPFKDATVDVFICSHVVHHLAYPMVFFENIMRMLKPGGYLVIQELETSLFFRILLRLMESEGWDLNKDVFNRNAQCTDFDKDPWSANCAIPHLLFDDPRIFEKNIPGLKVVRNELSECFIFPLSGGVLVKVPVPTLPLFMLKSIDVIDGVLVSLFPKVFALGRRVVLQKM